MDSLKNFSSHTRNWFLSALGEPTAIQKAAWPAIAGGEHTLVAAPTGTGKTLSAFLVYIDRYLDRLSRGELPRELQLIYVSPLKSLAGDIRENLKKPLDGICRQMKEENPGQDVQPELIVAIRTGDTPQSERRRMIKSPPHILITTPESLFLMISSASGKEILKTAQAIILDEIHALIDTKRGAHMMLTLARLDKLCERPLQRIGLSATINPLSLAADYLSPEPVTIAVPKMHKKVKFYITAPFSEGHKRMKDPIWQELAATVYAHCKDSGSVIVFTEGRMYAEKLAYYVNQIAGEGYARTHHGSLSKEARFEVEDSLRKGSLRMLCATSSMELGIDVGEIDEVFQIGCPHTISGTLQRLGRAGHNPNRTSVMYMFPRTSSEGLYCAITAEIAEGGGVEDAAPPEACLDILAQHLVSMSLGTGYKVQEVMDILPRAYPFRNITIEDVRDVLCMLAGDYEHELDIPVRPRLIYDRIHDCVEGDAYSRMLAVSAGGTIPDKGMYAVKTEDGVKLGELDEEFVYESRTGDRFLLGTFAWQIRKIEKDNVIVLPTPTIGAKLPFWKGDRKGRGIKTGIEFGRILRRLFLAHGDGTLYDELRRMGLDQAAAENAEDFLKRQITATGMIPTDETIVIEHYCNEEGDYHMMVHSIFGRRVNAPLAILVQEEARRRTNMDISCVDEENGFLIYSYGGDMLPEGLLQGIEVNSARPVLEAILPVTPLFHMTFRYNSAHALMMGVKKAGRLPLWIQRMRSAQMLESVIKYDRHPLVRETRRECLEDYWDLDGVEYILTAIQSGAVKVRELYSQLPSPMSLPLQWQVEAANMYDYSPTLSGTKQAAKEALNHVNAAKHEDAIKPAPEQLDKVSQRMRAPEDETQLHTLLMIEGDMEAGEVDIPVQWLTALIHREQVCYIEPGLWIAAEQEQEYYAALQEEQEKALLPIIRRMLRYRSAMTAEEIAGRYVLSEELIRRVLEDLCKKSAVVQDGDVYYHGELYERATHETVKSRRKQMKTQPPEHYAAYMAGRVRITAPAKEQLESAVKQLKDKLYPASLWESVLLPGRVNGYREEMLDTLLTQGEYFWRMWDNGCVSFHSYEDIDWDAGLEVMDKGTGKSQQSEMDEGIAKSRQTEMDEGIGWHIYEYLRKRGASFMQAIARLPELSDVTDVGLVNDALQELMKNGVVYADSFEPVRQYQKHSKGISPGSNQRYASRSDFKRNTPNKAALKQRVSMKVKALSTGRWDLVRPLRVKTIEQQIEDAFDATGLLCKETAGNIPWGKALEILRLWEYTGRVRRGYFVEGLSGAQFIHTKNFAGIMLALEQKSEHIIWLSASDPVQVWGKALSHKKDMTFMNIPGTVVGLYGGEPAAVFERKGKVLRIFNEEHCEECLKAFGAEYERRRIYPDSKRLILKEYPEWAGEFLKKAGFQREMQDYVLYRGYR